MWRVPLHRVYRAFPELDVFSNEECERFVLRAKRTRQRDGLEQLACWFVYLVAGCVVGLGAFALVVWLGSLPRPAGMNAPAWEGLIDTLHLLIVGVAAVAIGSGPYLVRDWLLIRTIRDSVVFARCPRCAQSLLGLPCADGTVRCPECGTLHALASLGMVPEDLRPAAQPLSAPGRDG